MKLFYVVMVMTLTSAALLIANSGLTFIHDLKSNVQRAARATAPSSWTPGSNGTNLKGKMFTMIDGASLRFFACPIPGVFNTASPMMTASPLAGVSVCLRYLADSKDKTIRSIFTLNPSTTPLELKFEYRQYFVKITKFGYSISDPMETYIQFWPNLGFEIWTRLCFTMDSRTNVAQVFSGPNMSIRRILQSRVLPWLHHYMVFHLLQWKCSVRRHL
ncbi:uncharacterized protein LOC121507104 isoform X2 [Cheilinus undulatus]|uniref:uncharacterized protein LOC121507104 isoform X2 n=1 Tax=Cheilinus undulatus TaxID=241271 RepID=UPI001BD2325D|nr:uncharacterized protein LOC121507104 isoform X2 [Cheilinus undulatus]